MLASWIAVTVLFGDTLLQQSKAFPMNRCDIIGQSKYRYYPCSTMAISKRQSSIKDTDNHQPKHRSSGKGEKESGQQQGNIHGQQWTGDPYEPVAFPSFRLDLTPESKLSANVAPKWQRPFLSRLRRRSNVTYFDNESSSSSIMATLWRIVAGGTPIVAVFPQAEHAITIRQFVDLLDFCHQVVPRDSSLQASFETIDGSPAIRFVPTTTSLPIVPTYKSKNIINAKTMERRLQAWVNRVLVKLQICPFTKSSKYSGQGVGPTVPVAKIAYHTSHACTVSGVMADAWQAMDDMLVAGPKEISSILLAVPNFDDRFRLWAGPVFTALEHSVIAAQATKTLGVVCFHPQYQTPDGSTFPGFGQMHSVTRLQKWSGGGGEMMDRSLAAAGGAWQRRTPHAVINVLRAEQLVAAEALRNTPQLYKENIQKLLAIADDLPKALAQEQQLK
jgi:hypothetical protein